METQNPGDPQPAEGAQAEPAPVPGQPQEEVVEEEVVVEEETEDEDESEDTE